MKASLQRHEGFTIPTARHLRFDQPSFHCTLSPDVPLCHSSPAKFCQQNSYKSARAHTREREGGEEGGGRGRGRERGRESETKLRLSLIFVAPADAGALAGTFKAQDVANTQLVYATFRVAPTKSTKSESESEGETVRFFRWATRKVYTEKPRAPTEPASIPSNKDAETHRLGVGRHSQRQSKGEG